MTRLDDILRIALRCVALAAIAFSSATVAEYFMRSATYCQPGGGCDEIRAWAYANQWGLGIPIFGVVGFTMLFTGSIFRQRLTLRMTGAFALLGGAIAIALIVQQQLLGAYCWLCVTVDSLAVVAAILGAVILARSKNADPQVNDSIVTPWWSLWILAAFGPIAFAMLSPDTEIPAVVRARYRDGAINIVEMADFECPYCREMHPNLRRALEGVEGDVNLVRVVVPLEFHLRARDAAKAYHCAVEQERGEEMADALFTSDDLSQQGLRATAERLGLDIEAYRACVRSGPIEERIRADERFAEAARMEGLPTVYIGERAFIGFDPAGGHQPFREAIEAARRGEGARTVIWPIAGVVVLSLLTGLAAFARRRS